jgi:uncharacterized protein (DUF1697 family)
MQKYVAFLRGINVGGRIVKMADLKECFESLGLTDVMTVLQSGNVVFAAGKSGLNSEDEIQKALEIAVSKRFNYDAKIQVYSMDTVRKVVEGYPFESREGFHDYVIFLEGALVDEMMSFAETLKPEVEKIAAGKRVVYWMAPKGQTLKNEMSKLLVKAKFKEFNTVRNINTLQKIVALV